MTKRIGRQTVSLPSSPTILSYASTVGKKEGEGPLGKYFEKVFDDVTFGENTWEKAESRLFLENYSLLKSKAEFSENDINYIIAGDLLNQCTASAFALRQRNIPYLGIYGACSTMAEGISLGAMLTDGGFAEKAVAMAGSHFCSAEKQFRFPLEYGGVRTPTSQWTVTGAGSVLIGYGGKIKITHITTGKIVDMGVKDANNMGCAMAPAFADTVNAHFEDTGFSPSDYDLILSGDLGLVGMDIAKDLLFKKNIDISKNYNDCGAMIFDKNQQDTHAGGSGCGCSGSVLCGYILPLMEKGICKNVLFIATGALMSPTSSQQGESIPSIAHAISLSV